MINKRVSQSGITLIEMVLGLALLSFIILGGVMALRSIAKSGIAIDLEAQAHLKLRAVTEQIRAEGVAFDLMDETPNQVRLEKLYPSVTVMSTIGPIDPATRTRNVKLVALWKDISANTGQRTIETEFAVASIRGKLNGGRVKVKVIDANTKIGVANVAISAKGQEIARVTTETNSEGIAELEGVILSKDAMIRVNGEPVKYFFDDASAPAATFFKDFKLDVVANKDNTVLYDTPIEMYAPGRIAGRVVDLLNPDIGVPGATLILVNRKGSLIIERTFSGMTTTTNADGDYSFDYLIPNARTGGRSLKPGYEVFLKGSAVYAALALEGDRVADPEFDQELYKHWVNVISGLTTEKNFATPKKGSIGGTVYGVDKDKKVSASGIPITVIATRSNSESYNSSNKEIRLKFTYMWNKFFGSTFAKADYDLGFNWAKYTPATGFNVAHFTPRIGETSSTHKLISEQYNWAYLTVGTGPVASPYTTIVVQGDVISGIIDKPRLLIGAQQTDVRSKSYAVSDIGTTLLEKIETFRTKIKMATPVLQDLYLLQRDALANVTGQIKLYDASNNLITSPIPASDVESNIVTVKWMDKGYGGIRYDVSGNAWLDKAYSLPVGAYDSTLKSYAFDMQNAGFNALPPNLYGEETKIRHRLIVKKTKSLKFTGFIYAMEKIYDSATKKIIWRPVPKNDLDIETDLLKVKGWFWNGGNWTPKFDDIEIEVKDGVFETKSSVPNLNYMSDEYKGESVPLALEWGNEKTTTIDSKYEGNVTRSYSLEVKRDAKLRWETNRIPRCSISSTEADLGCGPGFKYLLTNDRYESPENVESVSYDNKGPGKGFWNNVIQLNKVGRAAKITGGIKAPSGLKAVGAKVILYRSGSSSDFDPLFYTAVENADGAGNQFIFKDVPFVMTDGDNLVLTVEFPGAIPVEARTGAYDGMNWHRDFTLVSITRTPPKSGEGL